MDSQLTDTLRAILSDPESMKSIMKIAQNIGADLPSSGEPENETPPQDEANDRKDARGDAPQDARATEKAADAVLSSALPEKRKADGKKDSSAADNRIKLLMSLRPFLDPERQQKTDSLIRALGAAQVLYQLGENDLLKSFGL